MRRGNRKPRKVYPSEVFDIPIIRDMIYSAAAKERLYMNTKVKIVQTIRKLTSVKVEIDAVERRVYAIRHHDLAHPISEDTSEDDDTMKDIKSEFSHSGENTEKGMQPKPQMSSTPTAGKVMTLDQWRVSKAANAGANNAAAHPIMPGKVIVKPYKTRASKGTEKVMQPNLVTPKHGVALPLEKRKKQSAITKPSPQQQTGPPAATPDGSDAADGDAKMADDEKAALKAAAERARKAESNHVARMRILAALKYNGTDIILKLECIIQPNKEILDSGHMVYEGANEYESLSQETARYAVFVGGRSDLGRSLRVMARSFRTIGAYRRQLQESMANDIVKPLNKFTENDYPALEAEMKRLGAKRKKMEAAVASGGKKGAEATLRFERAASDVELLLQNDQDRVAEQREVLVQFLKLHLTFYEKTRDVIKESINDVYPRWVADPQPPEGLTE